MIAMRYSAKDLSGKLACKKDLLQTFGLPQEAVSKPVIGIVSRFAAQKGFDLIEAIAPQLLAEDLVITALGAGEPKYEKLFRELAKAFPPKFSVKVAYDNIIAHKIEAGADMFLMPSRYEPVRLEPDLQFEIRHGSHRARNRRVGRHDRPIRPSHGSRHRI